MPTPQPQEGGGREENYRNGASATIANNIIREIRVQTHTRGKSKRQVGKSVQTYTHTRTGSYIKAQLLQIRQIRGTCTVALSANLANDET